jgi:nitroimidazol reductase NimA-like FMN-containing flavoprotein (pyridoxamine 5'-phosphate oxidase superfamily)
MRVILPFLFYVPWALTVYGSPMLGFYATTGFVLYHYSMKARVMKRLGDDPTIIFGHYNKDGEAPDHEEAASRSCEGQGEAQEDEASEEEEEVLRPYTWGISSWTYTD